MPSIQERITQAKKDYAAAKTDVQREAAHARAEAARAEVGFSGGETGAEYIPLRRAPDVERAPTTIDTDRLQRRLFEEQQRARVAGLEKSRAAGLSVLRGEEREITPAFAGARRQTRAVSERGAQRFGEFLAQRGLTRAGGAALGETQRLGAQQVALGGLAQQETTALGDIARRRAGIETGFAADIEASRAGLAAQQLQAQITQQQTGEAARTAAQQQAFENALAQARITGQFGGAPTLAAAEFTEGVRQFDANLDFKTRQFEADNALDLRQQSFNEIQDRINTGIRQGQLSVSQGNALLAKKKFEAENDPSSQAFIQRQEALRIGGEAPGQPVTTTGFKTSPDFAEDLSQIINSTPEQKEVLRQQLQSNAQAFITKYGLDGYQALLAETTAF